MAGSMNPRRLSQYNGPEKATTKCPTNIRLSDGGLCGIGWVSRGQHRTAVPQASDSEGAGPKGCPMTLGKPVGPDVAAHGAVANLSTSDGIDIAASFRAVVDRIIVANRQPTAWQAGCLYAALCELAIGREKNARRWTCLALLPGVQQELPIGITPLPTAEELLQAFELINVPPTARR